MNRLDTKTITRVDVSVDRHGKASFAARPNGVFEGAINGVPYSLLSTEDSTTLTLGGRFRKVTYTNGQRMEGRGPQSYADYQAAHRNAPNVSGPGWPA